MNEVDKQWQQLLQQARQAPAPEGSPAPLGFAGRVVARWRSEATPSLSAASVWEFLSLRSVAFAALVMCVSLGANYDLLRDEWSGQDGTTEIIDELLTTP